MFHEKTCPGTVANLPREDPRPGRVPHRPVELALYASAQITSFATANGIIRSMANTGACSAIRKRAKLEDRPVEMAKLVRSRQSRRPSYPAPTASTSDHFADARISRHVSIQRGPTMKQLLSERARFVF